MWKLVRAPSTDSAERQPFGPSGVSSDQSPSPDLLPSRAMRSSASAWAIETDCTLPSKKSVYGELLRPALKGSPVFGAPRYQPYSHMRVFSDGYAHCATDGAR